VIRGFLGRFQREPDERSEIEGDEGQVDMGSVKTKVVAGVAAGVVTAAGAEIARRMLGGEDESGSSQDRNGRRPRSPKQGSQRARQNARTKEQLYTQAKRLNIEGRSKMTKAQLERAVRRAK
jgi:hypothetical protein